MFSTLFSIKKIVVNQVGVFISPSLKLVTNKYVLISKVTPDELIRFNCFTHYEKLPSRPCKIISNLDIDGVVHTQLLNYNGYVVKPNPAIKFVSTPRGDDFGFEHLDVLNSFVIQNSDPVKFVEITIKLLNQI